MGMGVGMTMLIIALKNGDPGIISTLSSTMPIMIIPILWIVIKIMLASSGNRCCSNVLSGVIFKLIRAFSTLTIFRSFVFNLR